MNIEIAIGTKKENLNVPDQNFVDALYENEVTYDLTGEAEVRRALENPIGAPDICEVIRPEDTVAIVTSDITRPCPSYKILPPLLEKLYQGGVKKENITVVFGLGSHRAHTEEEMIHLVGEEVYREVRCIDSNSCGFVHFGETKNGTPVDICRAVADADKVICLGNIEYHYFAGYSGGAKAIMPGVSTPDAIQSNHKMMILEDSCAGNLENNPLRMDIEEAASMLGVDYIVNVVLDTKKEIIFAVAGDVTKAHREGCRFLDRLYKKEIEERADIVVVSQGGAPKDLNLYQTQKALDNAKHAIKKGGTIILVGSCKEGLGNPTFEKWLTEALKPSDLIDRIKADFKLGGHKAAAIAMVLENAKIKLVSDMDSELVKSIFMEPYTDVQKAFDDALKEQGEDAKVIVMPFGGSTLPRAKN